MKRQPEKASQELIPGECFITSVKSLDKLRLWLWAEASIETSKEKALHWEKWSPYMQLERELRGKLQVKVESGQEVHLQSPEPGGGCLLCEGRSETHTTSCQNRSTRITLDSVTVSSFD
ncbi:hypothetical protein HPG69_013880 [Diceros bicornis minor]|uniref:Uncharacterized protein n=1 Tax=Diceros bicornis minor TaxID=77932 RepID=A0A7J7EMJ6_DICBM|nr:hypothetical protein HPG69_013880 [Diceros bicornis minor]